MPRQSRRKDHTWARPVSSAAPAACTIRNVTRHQALSLAAHAALATVNSARPPGYRDAFARRVGITEAVTATRLKHLCTEGLLCRQPYREPGQRNPLGDHLTEMGRDLVPALLALLQWGDRYLSGRAWASPPSGAPAAEPARG